MKGSLLAACVMLASAAAAAPAASSRDDIARLAFTNDLLQKRVSLAKGKDFYLLLDPAERSLTLMFKAALLQAYRVQGLEVGVPRVIWQTRSGATDWEGKIWSKGNLDPARALDRVEVQAPPPTKEGTEMEVKIPQTPEEKYPVPPRYHIRFDGGLSIEVRPPGTEDRGSFWTKLTSRFGAWWSDAKAASGGKDTVRLHVVLSKQDAESLYRALPPNTALLVVPPGP
jgi:hypothetical protein